MASEIQKVAAGQKVKASTINGLIDRASNVMKAYGCGLINDHGDANLQINAPIPTNRVGQKFRMPFDLYTSTCLSGESVLSVTVCRSHIPNQSGGMDEISSTTITFPQNEDVDIWLCESQSGQKCVKTSLDSQEELSLYPTKTLLWKLKSNGVVLEDCRVGCGGGGGGNTLLDLSSLDWYEISAQGVSAQTFHYNNLEEADKLDIKFGIAPVPAEGETPPDDVSASLDKWRFLVRPEEGGTLHYASLSSYLSGTVEISATPLETLSANIAVYPSPIKKGDITSFYNHWLQLAKYKKSDEGWEDAKKIWGFDNIPPIMWLVSRMSNTAFAMEQDNTDPRRGIITHCWCYVGRRLCILNDTNVQGPGTFYLQINTQNPQNPAIAIVGVNQDFPNGVPQNTNILTYYPLWTLPNIAQYDYTHSIGTAVDLRGIWHLPFYSD